MRSMLGVRLTERLALANEFYRKSQLGVLNRHSPPRAHNPPRDISTLASCPIVKAMGDNSWRDRAASEAQHITTNSRLPPSAAIWYNHKQFFKAGTVKKWQLLL